MTRLFLCLTFLVATTVSAGDGIVFNSESAMEESLVCMDQGSIDKVQGSDDPVDSCITHAGFNAGFGVSIAPHQTESLLDFHPFKSHSIRAPPIS